MADITIKELADALGVSKPTISKAIDALGIQGELRMVSNRFVLSEPQAAAVKSQILQNSEAKITEKQQSESENMAKKSPADSKKSQISQETMRMPSESVAATATTAETAFLETLQTTIEMMHQQIAVKDEQIAALGKSLQDTTAALNAAQEALQSTTTALTAAQALHAADKRSLIRIEDQEMKRKMSFWERRAAKKAAKKAEKSQDLE